MFGSWIIIPVFPTEITSVKITIKIMIIPIIPYSISLIPLNFSSYFTEYKNITISQSQFLNNNNNSYYYNLSIYYFNSNLNAVNPYDFTNYIYPISILVFLILGGITIFGTIKYRRRN